MSPLLQRIFTSLPFSNHVSPEVGVHIPTLWPGLGPFSTASGDSSSPSCATRKVAASSFTWPVPPALCHPWYGESSRWVGRGPILSCISDLLFTWGACVVFYFCCPFMLSFIAMLHQIFLVSSQLEPRHVSRQTL